MPDGRLDVARRAGAAAVALAVVVLTGAQSAGQEISTRSVSATVSFAPRTALTVSTRMLRFVVTDALTPATVSVEFSAAARTSTDGSVTLMANAADSVGLPSGVSLEIVSGSEGVVSGTVSSQQPVMAGRWTGSGVRSGRITFQLRAQPGSYDIPLTLFLQLQ